jgi:hypothetical protein
MNGTKGGAHENRDHGDGRRRRLFGARLAAAGEDVHFIARGQNLAALRANGLVLKSANGDLHLQSVSATDDPASIGTIDIIIFAVTLPMSISPRPSPISPSSSTPSLARPSAGPLRTRSMPRSPSLLWRRPSRAESPSAAA